MRSMANYKKLYFYALCMALSIQTGCSLLPQEEMLPAAPVLEPYYVKEYIKTQVTEGDIIETITIPATYQASKTETIKFPSSETQSGQTHMENRKLSDIFVKIGDKVKAGDLVAVLETGTLLEEIENLTNEIELLTLKLKQTKEMDRLTAGSSYMKIRELEENIYIKNKRLEQWIEEKEACEIRAGMDGMVSYVLDINTQLKSTKDVTILTILDEESCYYEVDSTYSSYFITEEPVLITTDRVTYEGEIFHPSHVSVDTEEETIYIKLLIPDFDIPVGSKGYIEKTIHTREDVLIIPSNTIIETKEGYYVYIEGEEGLKSLMKIEIGLIADGKAEVISGLAKGDSIIIE